MRVHFPVSKLAHLDDWTASDTEPAETSAGMLWLDTSSDPHVLKRRNDADDGWVTVGVTGGGTSFVRNFLTMGG